MIDEGSDVEVSAIDRDTEEPRIRVTVAGDIDVTLEMTPVSPAS